MLGKVGRLLRHPGFRDRPLGTLWRCAHWAGLIAAARLGQGGPSIFPLTPGGARVEVAPTLRYTELTAFILRDAMEPELQHLDRLVSAGDVFLDVGSNIGLYALRAAGLVGSVGRVVAVEPSVAAQSALSRNLALNPALAVTVVRKAISDSEGVVQLFHTSGGYDPQAFSLLSDGTASGSETVQTTTIDGIVAELGLARVDCIKLDVEGVEERAILGASETIARFSPTFILEMNGGPQNRDGLHENPAWDRLVELGYSFQRFDGGRLLDLQEKPLDFCNAIARRPS